MILPEARFPGRRGTEFMAYRKEEIETANERAAARVSGAPTVPAGGWQRNPRSSQESACRGFTRYSTASIRVAIPDRLDLSRGLMRVCSI